MSKEQAIVLYQPLLHSIACKILGSVSDAEDMVQETFLKWLTIDTSGIRNTRSYLIRVLTNNCLNHLESLQRKKEEWMEAVPQFFVEKWDAHIDFEKELGHALELIHQKLGPVERGIFLLREVFNLEYEDIQHIFEKKKEHCRQLLHRSRRKLLEENKPGEASETVPQRFLHTFKNACTHGNLQELIQVLKGEIK